MATFLPRSIENSPRAAARARASGAEPIDRHVIRPVLPRKSSRSPRRDHFSFQASMATFRLWTIQNSQSARARAAARALWEFCVVHNMHHTHKPMLTSRSNRAPLRVHFSSQVNTPTFRLWAIQNSQSARARGVLLPITDSIHTSPC